MLDAARRGRPRTSAENIERVRQAVSRSLMKSILTAVNELVLPLTTVHKVLHKRLRLHACKAQIVQRLQPNYKPKRKEFADSTLQRIFEDEEFCEDEELFAASSTDPVSINFLCHR